MTEQDRADRKAHLRQLVERALPMTPEWDSVRQNVALSVIALHQADVGKEFDIREQGGSLFLVEDGRVRLNLQGRDGSGLLSKLSEGLFDDQKGIAHHERNLVVRGGDSITVSLYKMLMAISYVQMGRPDDWSEMNDDFVRQFGANLSQFTDKYGRVFPLLREQAETFKSINS